MRKLRNQAGDSLDLLLDTLCNMFGGIVLITCLLALAAGNNTSSEFVPGPSGEAVGQLIERRIAIAEAELDGLKELLSAAGSSDDNSLRLLAMEKVELQRTLDRLRKQRAETAEDKASQFPVDQGRLVTGLRQEAKRLREQVVEFDIRKAATRQKEEDLTAKIKELEKRMEDQEQARTESLRFPKERTQVKRPWWVIIRYGKVYPLEIDGRSHYEGLIRVEIDDDAESFEPRRDSGFDLDRQTEQIKKLLRQAKSTGEYVGVIVYPEGESFSTFRQLKQLIHEVGAQYGIDVWRRNAPVQFSSKGSTPPPL
jgi:hypothetical protein